MERRVTSNPNTPLPPSSLRAKLPASGAAGSVTALEREPPDDGKARTGIELWLRRLAVLTFVFVYASVGVFLVILPWRPEWTHNHLLLSYPGLRQFIASGFVRGVVSGLGMLDIWIGFWEAVHYREEKRSFRLG
ncbi:MAG: hypothetical protein DMG85_14520 [Acidobacteria bacterium]|nr:MAG: hypothetical protein DMG85_14520 [Acidobacteriota bacterium]